MRGGALILGAGLAITVVSRLNAFDIWLSDYAYDFDLGAWAIDHSSSIWRPILYDGPKVPDSFVKGAGFILLNCGFAAA